MTERKNLPEGRRADSARVSTKRSRPKTGIYDRRDKRCITVYISITIWEYLIEISRNYITLGIFNSDFRYFYI